MMANSRLTSRHFFPVLHSVSYAGGWGQASLTTEDFVDKAAELGYRGVLLMAKRPHLSLLDYGPEERRRLRCRLESKSLDVVYVAGYTNFTADLEHRDIPHVEMQIHHVTELARLAHDLGGNMVRVFTGYESVAADYRSQWDLVVGALRQCARRAADVGVIIGVQNHHDIACSHETQFDLIEAVGEPNCLALFDAWAPALHGIDLVDGARKMAPITFHTTIANYQKRPRFRYKPEILNYETLMPVLQAVPIDEGFIDYRAFLTALDQSGFRGTVAYEMCSPVLGGGSIENLDRYARRFLEFMLELSANLCREVSALPETESRL
jgi:sugar phosphate isomerase/epimerase